MPRTKLLGIWPGSFLNRVCWRHAHRRPYGIKSQQLLLSVSFPPTPLVDSHGPDSRALLHQKVANAPGASCCQRTFQGYRAPVDIGWQCPSRQFCGPDSSSRPLTRILGRDWATGLKFCKRPRTLGKCHLLMLSAIGFDSQPPPT
jgi:hypothetical protein